ncbi:MAG TPA: hypothetical protein VK127_02345 [Nitrososphaerales archaeon]|nr:hypothetical protein [Nitrososphaerales archaeon]
MLRLGTRQMYLVLILLLLSPSVYFGSVYAAASLTAPSKMSQYTSTSSDGNWTLALGLSYPSYMISGLRVPVTLSVRLTFTRPYVALYLAQVGIEIRQAGLINSTTNVVQSWKTLFSNHTVVGRNYTVAGTVTKVFYPPITYPVNGSVADVLAAGRKLAIDGIANFTTYAAPGTSASTSTQIISILDSQTTYLTQLSDVGSSLSWVFYQIVSVAIVSVVYTRVRTRLPGPADGEYSTRLGSLRLERSLARLEDWMKADMISETKYKELKERFERELDELKRRIQGSI